MTTVTPEDALAHLPVSLRKELLDSFNLIVGNYRLHRWEPSELNGGKLSEVVYSILRGHVDGSLPKRASKPRNMVDSCRNLERETAFPRSIRIQIPRILVALYEVRNNRGVGHVGGDVDPNHMDAAIVVASAKWILAELIRVFHDLSPMEASQVVESLIDRETPMIWSVNGIKRVLDPSLSMKSKTLLLLYDSVSPVSETDMFSWVC